MRLSVKISMLAFAAMFAFSTPAEAQFGLGKLARKARKAIGLQTTQDKYEEFREQQAKEDKIRQRKNDSIKAVVASITPTIPQPAAEGTAPVAIKWKDTRIGEWDPVKLEITFNKTYDEGEYAGQKVSYKLNPATGQWTSKKGTDVGSMSNDGTIVSPNLGTIQFDPKTNKISKDGEVIGDVTMLKASSYGTAIGSFEGHVSPLLMAFTFHGSLISEKQVAEWKEAKIKADQEAAERAAKARAEAAAREEARKKEWAELNCEIMASNGITLGYVRANGVVEASNRSTIGYIQPNGTIERSNRTTIGYVQPNGTVEKSNRMTLGYFDGRTFEKSNRLTCGYFSGGTFEASNRLTIGKIRGNYNNTVLAACFFFFFFPEEVDK
ncbi:MAG: hypothetical protein J6W38_00550 [Prevotella sp.]|nr:hypothetical protein [Prevotella sp.]